MALNSDLPPLSASPSKLYFNYTSSLPRFSLPDAYSADKEEIMTKVLKALTDYIDRPYG